MWINWENLKNQYGLLEVSLTSFQLLSAVHARVCVPFACWYSQQGNITSFHCCLASKWELGRYAAFRARRAERALCLLPCEAEELTEETVQLMKYPKKPFHRNCARGCSVQAMAGLGELLAAPGLDLPQDTSKLLLLCLCQGGREGGQKVFWLCTALNKHSSIRLIVTTCLGISATCGRGDDVPAAPPGTGSLPFPLAQEGALFFFLSFYVVLICLLTISGTGDSNQKNIPLHSVNP